MVGGKDILRLVLATVALLGIADVSDLTVNAQAIVPLERAHAHNDYLHPRPLLDALAEGFCSVEADIYLIDDQLLVAHERDKARSDRTLQALYLEPLKARIAENAGRVYRDGPAFTLLIDIKSEAEATYRALHAGLAKYSHMLSSVSDGRAQTGAVNVVISGNRPQATIAAQPVRYCGIDGRLSDLTSDKPAHLMPMLSDNWTLNFQWRGEGTMPEAETKRLAEIVRQAHARGRVVRFWATPETPTVWQALADADVDLINTDHLDQLTKFLKQK
jgi:hypothetical protein